MSMNSKNCILAALSFLFSMVAAFSQVRPVPPRTQKPSPGPARPAYMQYFKAYEENPMVTKVVLKNGLTVLVNEFKGAPLVALSTYIKCGYADEPMELTGISDVLEHVIFGKTPTRGAGVIGKEIRALGGRWQSDAGLEHITHDIVVPSMQWKKALELEADAVLNPIFDQDEISHAIETALHESQEWLGPADSPGRRRLLPHEIILGAVGYGRTRFGDSLRNLGRERLVDYHKSCYQPARLVLVISGDVTSSEVLNEVVRHYAKLNSGPDRTARIARGSAAHAFHFSESRGSLQKPRVLFGFQTVPAGAADYPALELLRGILGLGEGSVFSRRLRDQKKAALGGWVDHLARADTGYFAVQLEADPKDIDRCEITALTELELIKRQEPDEFEMSRAWALLEREYWDRLQTVSGRAHTIADFELLGDWKKMNAHLARLRQVKPADVVRVAEKYLRLDNCSLVEYLPVSHESRNLTTEKVLSVFQQLLDPAADQELGEREREVVPAVEIPQEGTLFKASEIRFAFKTASILRGPELFIREDHTLPLIHLGFFFAGGKLFEKAENSGVTALMLKCMLRGTREKDSNQFFRQLEIYGGQLFPIVTDDYFGFQLSVLSRNIEPALDLLAQMITVPKFEDEEIDRQKQALLDLIKRNNELDQIRARGILQAALYKGHAYALPVDGTEASVSALSPAAVKEWFKTTVERKKPIIAIIGDTQGTNLASFFVRNFSGSRFQNIKLPESFAAPLAAKIKIDAGAAGDSGYVLLGFQAPPQADEDYFPVRVLANYIGGVGGRLSDQVNAACSLGCELSLEYKPHLRGGLVAAGVSVPPGNEDKILKVLEDELQKLPEAVITYRDFRAAMSQAVGRFNIDMQSRFNQIATVVENMLAGRGLDAIQEETTRLQEVKQEDLPEFAQRIFKLEKSVSIRIPGKAQVAR